MPFLRDNETYARHFYEYAKSVQLKCQYKLFAVAFESRIGFQRLAHVQAVADFHLEKSVDLRQADKVYRVALEILDSAPARKAYQKFGERVK